MDKKLITAKAIIAAVKDQEAERTSWDGINRECLEARMMKVKTKDVTFIIYATVDGESLKDISEEIRSKDVGFEKVDLYSREATWDGGVSVGGLFSRKLEESDRIFDENDEDHYTIADAIEDAFEGSFRDALCPGFRWMKIKP